jgi:hypothetical protein
MSLLFLLTKRIDIQKGIICNKQGHLIEAIGISHDDETKKLIDLIDGLQKIVKPTEEQIAKGELISVISGSRSIACFYGESNVIALLLSKQYVHAEIEAAFQALTLFKGQKTDGNDNLSWEFTTNLPIGNVKENSLETNLEKSTIQWNELLEELSHEASNPSMDGQEHEFDAVFSGNLKHLGVPDFLEFLKTGGRTGILHLQSWEGSARLYLKTGKLVGGSSLKTKSIGQWLLANKKISEEQLNTALLAQKEKKQEPLGSILFDMGFVDAELIRTTLFEQIQEVLKEIVVWKEGYFHFEPERDGCLSKISPALAIDTQFLLLEVFRQIDEEKLAKGDVNGGPLEDLPDELKDDLKEGGQEKIKIEGMVEAKETSTAAETSEAKPDSEAEAKGKAKAELKAEPKEKAKEEIKDKAKEKSREKAKEKAY